MRRAIQLALSAIAIASMPGLVLASDCPGNPNALGVSRTVEIDTTGGPGFGFQHYKAHDFLADKEVVLTFDDGPQRHHTEAVLAALKAHCTKATFFSIGKMAIAMPEIIRQTVKDGHTVGSHTWSHANLGKPPAKIDPIEEIEKGVSGVARAVGGPTSPFFRYPFLRDSKETVQHLAKRNIAIFSTDIDSFDFKHRNPDRLVADIMKKLDKAGKGIVLMHDIQPVTGKAVPGLLTALKKGGYKIVHLTAKTPVSTLPDYDKLIETASSRSFLPTPGAQRPTSSVVKTVK